jgi:hypothetical protein
LQSSSFVVRVSSMILPATCAVLVQTFWPVHDVAAGHLLREGLDRGGVKAGVGLGEAEGALVLPRHEARNPARLLLGGAEDDDGVRTEQVDVHGACRGHAAAVAGHLVHHDRRLGDAEAGAAVLGRHRDAEPAGVGHRAVEVLRKLAVVVAGQPVVVVEALDDGGHAVADSAVVLADREVHQEALLS